MTITPRRTQRQGQATTASDTPTNVTTTSVALATGDVIRIRTRTVAKTTGGALGGSWSTTASFKNVAGTVSQIGSTNQTAGQRDASLNSASVGYVISGTAVIVEVTGLNATQVEWTLRTRAWFC
jgi:hypothetical protein